MSVTKVSDNMKVANLAGGHPSRRLQQMFGHVHKRGQSRRWRHTWS